MKAKCFKTLDRLVGDALHIQVIKVIGSQFLIGLVVSQDMVDDHQQAVGDCYHSFGFAYPFGEAMVLEIDPVLRRPPTFGVNTSVVHR